MIISPRKAATVTTSLLMPAILAACASSNATDGSNPSRSADDRFIGGEDEIIVLYQVNTRQFSESGSFDAVREQLPRLRDMGVNMIWFKPIHPIGNVERKGTLGSPYAASDYLAINPEHGDADDFRELVDAAHDLGIRVILDWVANHTAWDHIWTQTHPDYFVRDENGNTRVVNDSWTDVIQLDHDNPEQRRAMIDAMVYWVREFDIDGFRCDVAELVPPSFWDTAITELNGVKPVFMLAEGNRPDLYDVGFDATYAWFFGYIAERVAKGEASAADLVAAFRQDEVRYPDNAIRMHFTSNHDWNSWNGTVEERYGDAAQAFAVMSFVLDGIPLIYNGQEAGLDKRLEFFEKDPIGWREHPNAEFYTTLADLKASNPALRHATVDTDQSFLTVSDRERGIALLRRHVGGDGERVLFVANLSPFETRIGVTLAGDAGRYRDVFSDDHVELDPIHRFDLPPWAWRLYESR